MLDGDTYRELVDLGNYHDQLMRHFDRKVGMAARSDSRKWLTQQRDLHKRYADLIARMLKDG